uniref:Secreted protein n=1 Tax=Pipistrellus kuhlii TaxID=59472 RepID=A0A7J7YXP8_PIPKU|nr:hypothetical protein mPipKuh1_009825 [Pipistrellus kuhlii]
MLKIRFSFSAAFYLGSCLARGKVCWLPQGQAQQRWASSPDSLYSAFSASRHLDASLSLFSPQRSHPLLASLPLSRALCLLPSLSLLYLQNCHVLQKNVELSRELPVPGLGLSSPTCPLLPSGLQEGYLSHRM